MEELKQDLLREDIGQEETEMNQILKIVQMIAWKIFKLDSTNETQLEESSQQENEEEESLQLNVPGAPPNTGDTLDSTYSGACIIQILQISKTLKLLWIQNSDNAGRSARRSARKRERVKFPSHEVTNDIIYPTLGIRIK